MRRLAEFPLLPAAATAALPALVDSAAKGFGVLVVAGIVALGFRRASAAIRHLALERARGISLGYRIRYGVVLVGQREWLSPAREAASVSPAPILPASEIRGDAATGRP